MTRKIIDKFSRLQGYPAGTISPKVKELQSAINSMAQYDSRLSRALNKAVTHMVENSGRDDDFDFYGESMSDLMAEGDDYYLHYLDLATEWVEYKEAVENGEFEALEPYDKILEQVRRVADLDL